MDILRHNIDPHVRLGQSLYSECVTRFVNRTVIPVCAKWRASWVGHFHEMVRLNFDANMRKCFSMVSHRFWWRVRHGPIYKWVTHIVIGTMTHHSRGSRGASYSYKWHLHQSWFSLNLLELIKLLYISYLNYLPKYSLQKKYRLQVIQIIFIHSPWPCLQLRVYKITMLYFICMLQRHSGSAVPPSFYTIQATYNFMSSISHTATHLQ